MRCDPVLAIWAALQPSEQVVCSAKGYRDAWKGTEAMCSWRKGFCKNAPHANYASGIPNLIYDLTHWKRSRNFRDFGVPASTAACKVHTKAMPELNKDAFSALDHQVSFKAYQAQDCQ